VCIWRLRRAVCEPTIATGGLADLESPQHLRFLVSTSATVLGVRTSIDDVATVCGSQARDSQGRD